MGNFCFVEVSIFSVKLSYESIIVESFSMKNQEIAQIFDQMADIIELQDKSKDRFRITAYRNAARTLREISKDVKTLLEEGKLQDLPGIGESLAKKIEEYLKTGKIKKHEQLKKTVSSSLLELLEIPHLGPKTVKTLHDKLKIKSLKDLEKALKTGKVEKLEHFGEKSAQNIKEGLKRRKESSKRIMLGEAYIIANYLIDQIKKCKEVKQISMAGSLRRMEETIGDIDLLASGKNPAKIINFFTELPDVKKILAKGDTKASVLLKQGRQADIRVIEPKCFGAALQYFTGSKQHNIHIRKIAKAKGLKVSEYGIFRKNKRLAGKTEEEMYKTLKMQLPPAEIREDIGEIEAAINQKIPKLIELEDIKGDFHVHTKWSDGQATIEEMAKEAEKHGYKYIGIADHSSELKIAHGLTVDRLMEQKQEIEKLNKKMRIKILHGAEINILPDGTLDYPDEILKKLDFVIVSIHSRFNQDNTERILKAMENPYVDILGHPTGRLMPIRDAYSLDLKKIFKKAEETGTILEINCQYQRLDLKDTYIREAKKYKVKFAISTDSHTDRAFWLISLGIGIARRGWLEAKDVINTYTLPKLKKVFGKKRI